MSCYMCVVTFTKWCSFWDSARFRGTESRIANEEPVTRRLPLPLPRGCPVGEDQSRATAGISIARIPESRAWNRQSMEWPRCCRKVYWTKLVQNGQNDHFGQNDLIPNWILAFARPKWTILAYFGPFCPKQVYFGPFRSAANRTLATPDRYSAARSKKRVEPQ